MRLYLLLLLVCVWKSHRLLADDAPNVEKTTHTYKTVGELKIEADVYRLSDATSRPVLVWIHGGALISGSRSGVPKELLDLARTEGYCLVSIDYRLAPEVKLPAIIEDLKDALRWIRADGPKLFHADPAKLVVSGGSAGGYLTLMAGLIGEPKPAALVAYWGYGDVDGDWYTKPSEHYRRSPLVTEEEARKAVVGGVLAGVSEKAASDARFRYYLYLRQNGLWTKEVTGIDPVQDARRLDEYCPVRKAGPDFPPTVLVHGTEDTDVPHDRSRDMAETLQRLKVPCELLSVPGAGHGLGGGDKEAAARARARALELIRTHLRSDRPPADAKE